MSPLYTAQRVGTLVGNFILALECGPRKEEMWHREDGNKSIVCAQQKETMCTYTLQVLYAIISTGELTVQGRCPKNARSINFFR